MIDLHCHILPGVDDGAETLETAVEMARLAGRDGVETIVATPHLFKGSHSPPDFDLFEKKKEELESALGREEIDVSIRTGAEVHIAHSLVDELGRSRKKMVINGSAYMFVEFPPDHVYPGVQNLFFELLSAGVIPIIAHPERNSVFAQKPGLLYDLVCMGALAQANRGSFLGVYGRTAAAVVGRLLEHNLVHFIASDGHDTVSLPPVLADAVASVRPLIGDEKARALVRDNPRAVLEDREIPYLPSPVDPRKSRRTFSFRWRGFFKGGS
jgi:protein-tyrosine phosphatase